jgi:hypothetical protein
MEWDRHESKSTAFATEAKRFNERAVEQVDLEILGP